MRVLREQREVATRLTALRLADSKNARLDVVVAQSTISRQASALGHTRDDNPRLVGRNWVMLSRPTQFVST